MKLRSELPEDLAVFPSAIPEHSKYPYRDWRLVERDSIEEARFFAVEGGFLIVEYKDEEKEAINIASLKNSELEWIRGNTDAREEALVESEEAIAEVEEGNLEGEQRVPERVQFCNLDSFREVVGLFARIQIDSWTRHP